MRKNELCMWESLRKLIEENANSSKQLSFSSGEVRNKVEEENEDQRMKSFLC